MIPRDTDIAREELERLFAEIEAYLRVVEAFRCEGHEPRWRRDTIAHGHA